MDSSRRARHASPLQPPSRRKPDVDVGALDALLFRVFGRSHDISYERAPEGVSTPVYQLRRTGETFYLRVAETETASLAPEAAVHDHLRQIGVRVPEVIHLEVFDERLRRSVMITTEISGGPVDAHTAPDTIRNTYLAAGRDLALINQVPVDGFGWVRRDGPAWPLRAEHAGYADFIERGMTSAGGLDDTLRRLHGLVLSGLQIATVERIAADEVKAEPEAGRLAHGDFGVGHVFQHDGGYSGIIDLGEIRGAQRPATTWPNSTHTPSAATGN